MNWWSSMHLFSSRTDYIVDYLTDIISTRYPEHLIIGDYFEKIERLRGQHLADQHMHASDCYFIQKYFSLYSKPTPGAVIVQDFKERSWSLNIFGDILKQPNHVSCISNRLFSCGDGFKGVMFHTTMDMSKEVKCTAVNHSFGIRKNGLFECRIYIADKKQICTIHRASNPIENYDENTETLPEVFPNVNWNMILKEKDISTFSSLIGENLQIVVGGDDYHKTLAEKYLFEKTFKLYNIYNVV